MNPFEAELIYLTEITSFTIYNFFFKIIILYLKYSTYKKIIHSNVGHVAILCMKEI